jgi:uncharacterized protein with ParB-like and HNH nuclease domain
MDAEIKTIECTPKNLIDQNRFFAIPIYQRLYAWDEEQIIKLLEDLHSSFQANNHNKNKDYFIGNWVISLSTENTRYDIIDGQQRMTTLWLMGFVLRKNFPDWSGFLCESNRENKKLRLDFIAREGDRKFLRSLLDRPNMDINNLIDEVRTQESMADDINPVMVSALKIINEFVVTKIKSLDDKKKFARFVFEHTKFVGIILPNVDGTYLNKYFEVMNNRGVQLEKHEILKALLLSKLPAEKRKAYANVWNACANMSVYIESFVGCNKNKIAGFTKNTSINDDFIKIFQNEKTGQKQNLSELLKNLDLDYLDNEGAIKTSAMTQSKNNSTDDNERYISIVNFPYFLLHVLRLMKKESGIKIADKDLISIFKKELTGDQTIRFLNELLRYRILFDKYVIKSVQKDNSALWQIRELKHDKDGDGFSRVAKRENKSLEMIEAFLQISTQQDIWLSLLLKKLGEETITSDDYLVEYLENVDRLLAKERLGNNNKKTVFEQLFRNEEMETMEVPSDWRTYLDKGTSTLRYWFFKLDYLLWKKNKDKYSTFQFRQNRSVEHIHAQSQNNESNIWDKSEIDSFGNLALISVSSNSQNSDHGFGLKKEYFKQRTEKYGCESLKLALIFENEKWEKKECEEHGNEMKKIIAESLL